MGKLEKITVSGSFSEDTGFGIVKLVEWNIYQPRVRAC